MNTKPLFASLVAQRPNNDMFDRKQRELKSIVKIMQDKSKNSIWLTKQCFMEGKLN